MNDGRVRFACPACGKNLKVPLRMAGRRGRCPKCSQKIDVPDPDADLPVLPQAGDTAECMEVLSSSDGDTKECPICAERVKARAKRCRYCGETLDVEAVPSSREGSERWKALISCVANIGRNSGISADQLAQYSFGLGVASLLFVFLTGIPSIMIGAVALCRQRERIEVLRAPWMATLGIGISAFTSWAVLAYSVPTLGLLVSLLGLGFALAYLVPGTRESLVRILGATVAVCIGFVLLVVAMRANEDNYSPPSVSRSVEARVLAEDYKANEVNADHKYKGKILRVTGEVTSISKDIFDNPEIKLRSGTMFIRIDCSFRDSEHRKLGALRKGQIITLVGECDGLTLHTVFLSGCTLE